MEPPTARANSRYAEAMATLPQLARALVVIHGRTRGSMDGAGVVTYDLAAEDLERLRAGMIGAARCYLAAGAEAVMLPLHGMHPVRREADLEPLRGRTLRPSDFSMCYAVHLFGGAAMGGSPEAGVCDESGAVFGVRGLYVVDAASLPTATGVNPQITIMANALRIATEITSR